MDALAGPQVAQVAALDRGSPELDPPTLVGQD